VAADVPLIDLDVAPRAVAAAGPWRHRLAAPRAASVLAVVVVALAALGAGAPLPPPLRGLLSAGGQPAAAFVLSPDSLYAASFGTNPNSESAVRAYSLTDGSVRWATALPQNVQNLVYDGTAHVLMGRSGTAPEVSFLDARTGEVLWRDESPATGVVTLSGDTVLLQADVPRGGRALRLVEARTGRQIWRRVVDAAGYFGPDDVWDGTSARVIAADGRGRVIVLRYADGAVLARGELDVRIPRPDDVLNTDLVGISTVGDTLYVSRRERGATTLTAWAVPAVRRLWQSAGAPVGRVLDCGAVLCVADDGQVSGIDPGTGAVRWRRSDLAFALRNDDHSLYAYDRQDTPHMSLLDAVTGVQLRALGPAVQVGDVLLRYDTAVVGRTLVEVGNPADGTLHVAGALATAAPYGCEAEGPYLACPTIAGPTQVWRVPMPLG
jgi:outer membrane protein assembly factor BamB